MATWLEILQYPKLPYDTDEVYNKNNWKHILYTVYKVSVLSHPVDMCVCIFTISECTLARQK